MDDTGELFFGREWVALNVLADGSCHPPPATPCKDKLHCKSAWHLGPKVYSVTNLTKFYQCFVQLKQEGQRRYGRCNHANCYWQSTVRRPKPCKHIRHALRWHVTLMRRARHRATAA